MNRACIVAVLALLLATARPAHAYDPILLRSFDGGGVAFATSGSYKLGGTIGQHDAGRLAGGAFTLAGGFWLGGGRNITAVAVGEVPAYAFRVFPMTPNPVQSRARVAFDLPSTSRVRVMVFDVSGRLVQRLDLGSLPAGHRERTWSAVDGSGRPLPSGVYFLRIEAGRHRATQKALLIQ